MAREIRLDVAGDNIHASRMRAGVRGEGNVTNVVISFDESWDGYAKKITWWDALEQNPVVRTLTADLASDTRTYQTTIPPEPLTEEGECTLVIDGYADGKRARSAAVRLEVDYAPVDDGAGDPADPTPTQAEQLQTQIETLLRRRDVFYAIYGTTTNAEILEAYEAGKAVYMKKDGNYGVYPLITIAGDSFAYFGCVIYSRNFKRYMCSADTWRTDDAVLLAIEPSSISVILPASGWDSSAKTQTVTASGVLADETKQLITPTPAMESQTAYYGAGIRCTNQAADSLTFTAETVPTEDLTIYVTIQEVSVS